MKYNFLKQTFYTLIFAICSLSVAAQSYWQQQVSYQMNIDFDASKHQFTGSQELTYTNNSPDTLHRIFYHLYFNAFQPNSMMDVRSRTISDPDRRVQDRISQLDASEIGYQKIQSLLQDGEKLTYEVEGTVLEVNLSKAILPGQTTVFNMEFEGQVPSQIRRSGRNNAEGIDYSMAQWYPKVAEYDERGWHAHPYVGREFFAPWGDFEVNITIDKNYVLAGTGVLQNPNEIGYGYEDKGVNVKRRGKKLTWKFKAENVHDFMWAADPEYTQITSRVKNGPLLRFFYLPNEKTEAWQELPAFAVKAFEFIQENYGNYPYSQYAIIQGGDGGMEYPMATLITGERSLESLLGVTVHEAMHSWYQGVLATNESYFAWMDEGFTTYATAETMSNIYPGSNRTQVRNYQRYANLVKSGIEEPLSTHSDHFQTNRAYGRAAYTKGAVALAQMNYVLGKETTARALKRYYNEWKFKHPDANDWIRVFEKESGLELDWYLDYWVNTTHFIDYAIDAVNDDEGKTSITLKRIGKMPMPIEVLVTFKDGEQKLFYAPLAMMRGEKTHEAEMQRVILPDWPWTNENYEFTIDVPIGEISSMVIDNSGYMADVERSNNQWNSD